MQDIFKFWPKCLSLFLKKRSQCIEILEFFRQVCNNCPQYLSQLAFVHSVNVKCIIYIIQLICVKANHMSLFQQMFSKQTKEAFIFKWLLGSEGDDILHGLLSLKKSTSCNLMLFHYISTQEDTHRPSTLTVTHINLNSCIIIKHIIRNKMNAKHTHNKLWWQNNYRIIIKSESIAIP